MGFGDVVPISKAEKAYCVVAVAVGAVVYGTVIYAIYRIESDVEPNEFLDK